MAELLRIIPTTAKLNRKLSFLWRLIPIFAFSDGMISLSMMSTYSLLELSDGAEYKALDLKITGT